MKTPELKMVRDNPDSFAPRPEAGIPYRDGATLPPALSPRYSRGSAPGSQSGSGQANAGITYRDGATVAAQPGPARGGASKSGFWNQGLRWKDKVQGTLAGGNFLADVYEADLRDMADRGVDPALSAPPNQREQGQLTPSTYRAGKYFAASPSQKQAMTMELEDRFADHLGALVGAHQRLRATEEVPDPMKFPGGTAGRAVSEVVEFTGGGLLGQLPGLSVVLGMPEDVITGALKRHGINPADPDTDLRDVGVLVSDPAFRDSVLVNFPFGGAPAGKPVGERIGVAGEESAGPFIKGQVETEMMKRILKKLY